MRFLSLMSHPPLEVVVWGGLLHGLGIGCFTVAGQLFLDSRAERRQRSSVQSLFLMLTSGLASLLGNLAAGELSARGGLDGPLMFFVPCVINGAMLIYFLTGFRSHFSSVDRAGATNANLPPRPYAVRGKVCPGNLVTESADG